MILSSLFLVSSPKMHPSLMVNIFGAGGCTNNCSYHQEISQASHSELRSTAALTTAVACRHLTISSILIAILSLPYLLVAQLISASPLLSLPTAIMCINMSSQYRPPLPPLFEPHTCSALTANTQSAHCHTFKAARKDQVSLAQLPAP